MSHGTEWAARLRRIAGPVLAKTPLVAPATAAEKLDYIGSFTDEAGTRRHWDPFLLGHMLGVRVKPSREPWLWSWNALASTEADALGTGRLSPPFFAEPDSWSLEQETEKELAGLHAWSWLVGREPLAHARGSVDPRFDAAVQWTIANIQPDNATNHPWAIQVFLSRAADPTPDTDARMYAETMLHNCLVTTGQPDLVSALILWDAAKWLTPEA